MLSKCCFRLHVRAHSSCSSASGLEGTAPRARERAAALWPCLWVPHTAIFRRVGLSDGSVFLWLTVLLLWLLFFFLIHLLMWPHVCAACQAGSKLMNRKGPGLRPPRSSRQGRRVHRPPCGIQTLKGRVRGTGEGDGKDWQTRAGGEGPRPEDVALACPPEESQPPRPASTSPEPQVRQTDFQGSSNVRPQGRAIFQASGF